MTRETFKTGYKDDEQYVVGGALLNKFGNSMNASAGGARGGATSVRRGAVDSITTLRTQRQTDLIRIKNDSGDSRRRYEVLAINGLYDSYQDVAEIPFDKLSVKGESPPGGYCKIAVLLQYAAAGEPVEAQVSGECPALVNIVNKQHRRAFPKKDTHVLESGFCGPAEILWRPDDTGEQLCAVRLGAGQSVKLLVKCDTSGVPAATYTTDAVTPGKANCAVWHWDESQAKDVPLLDGSTAVTQEVLNNAPDAIDGGSYGRLLWVASDDDWKFRVVVEYCNVGFTS